MARRPPRPSRCALPWPASRLLSSRPMTTAIWRAPSCAFPASRHGSERPRSWHEAGGVPCPLRSSVTPRSQPSYVKRSIWPRPSTRHMPHAWNGSASIVHRPEAGSAASGSPRGRRAEMQIERSGVPQTPSISRHIPGRADNHRSTSSVGDCGYTTSISRDPSASPQEGRSCVPAAWPALASPRPRHRETLGRGRRRRPCGCARR